MSWWDKNKSSFSREEQEIIDKLIKEQNVAKYIDIKLQELFEKEKQLIGKGDTQELEEIGEEIENFVKRKIKADKKEKDLQKKLGKTIEQQVENLREMIQSAIDTFREDVESKWIHKDWQQKEEDRTFALVVQGLQEELDNLCEKKDVKGLRKLFTEGFYKRTKQFYDHHPDLRKKRLG